ncbi:ribonuclease H-like domain-containing protein [Armillaria novae-zelandiae]|uniref:3'-5' exonuclease n=1 Tax=Armillaria novae-zelandiae TaxID=153914 RepID=A0AA39T3P0_9AGAR|nr:ribonuclease H-like domain-containing protein [Armillaria novae-zelandiae]
MELPSQVKVVVQKSTSQIEATVLSLITSMPENEESVLVTAIVQLAYKDTIWIFQLNDHIHSGPFPSQLITFLKNPCILKVGQNVNLDLRNLQEESGIKQPFAGGVDVAHLPKCKGVVKNTWISLADLCARVLKVHLNKDLATRISPDWHSDELSSEQLHYAALNAWASLKIYEELEQMQVPGEVIAFTPGQDIFLCP